MCRLVVQLFLVWILVVKAQEPEPEPEGSEEKEGSAGPAFNWGEGSKLHIVRLPTTEEEMTQMVFAVSKAAQQQTKQLFLRDLQKGKMAVENDIFVVNQVEDMTESKIGSMEGWSPEFGQLRRDKEGPFAKEKSFERVRKLSRNRNRKSTVEMLTLEIYKDLRLMREDMAILEKHQYYIIVQISGMAIFLMYKIIKMAVEYKKNREHKKAIAQRKDRMEMHIPMSSAMVAIF